LGGTEHRYSLQCITSFSKTNCCVCLCVPQLTDSCNSSFHGLTHLIRLQITCTLLPFISRKHSIKAETKLVPCHAMPCHVVPALCPLPSALCPSPSVYTVYTKHASYHTTQSTHPPSSRRSLASVCLAVGCRPFAVCPIVWGAGKSPLAAARHLSSPRPWWMVVGSRCCSAAAAAAFLPQSACVGCLAGDMLRRGGRRGDVVGSRWCGGARWNGSVKGEEGLEEVEEDDMVVCSSGDGLVLYLWRGM